MKDIGLKDKNETFKNVVDTLLLEWHNTLHFSGMGYLECICADAIKIHDHCPNLYIEEKIDLFDNLWIKLMLSLV